MKMPQIPPDETAILREVAKNPDRLPQILEAVAGWDAQEQYHHWDKLSHLSPPGDLTHREWWLGIKLRRKAMSKDVPLQDKKGRPFACAEVDQVLENLHQIDMMAGRLEAPQQILDSETRDTYYVSSLIEEAITSSQIEGASTTRRVAKEMIRSGRRPRDRSEQMIQNNYRVMEKIAEWKNDPLTSELIFEIHRIATEKTLDDASAAGRLRRADEEVHVSDEFGEVFHVPPRAEELAKRLEALCSFANGKSNNGFLHPVIQSIILHFWLSYDHPFVDGNGRTARALFYWSMLRHGYWLFEFVSISRTIRKAPAKYGYAFLHTETDDNDLTYFVLYHLEIMQRAIQDFYTYLKHKQEQIRALEESVHSTALLNFRQQALIVHALKHPQHRYTIYSHQLSHRVVYQTARADLLDLANQGLLKQEKVGKTYFFCPVAKMDEILSHIGKRSSKKGSARHT